MGAGYPPDSVQAMVGSRFWRQYWWQSPGSTTITGWPSTRIGVSSAAMHWNAKPGSDPGAVPGPVAEKSCPWFFFRQPNFCPKRVKEFLMEAKRENGVGSIASIISRSLNSSWFCGGSSKSLIDLKSSKNSSPFATESPDKGPRPDAADYQMDVKTWL